MVDFTILTRLEHDDDACRETVEVSRVIQPLVQSGAEVPMVNLVDIAIPTQAQQAAEGLGLKVQRSVTNGTRIRQIPRDEAELVVEYLRDWGFTVRIVELDPDGGHPLQPSTPKAA